MITLSFEKERHNHVTYLVLRDQGMNFGITDQTALERLEQCKRFSIAAYPKAGKDGDDGSWDYSFRLINDFFNITAGEDLTKIAECLIRCNVIIHTFRACPTPNTRILIADISKELDLLDRDINLYNKFVDFCAVNVPMKDMSGIGKRPQDSVKLTFYPQDIIQLLGVVAMSKLLAPIYSEMIQALMAIGINSKYKELLIVNITNPILNNRCPNLVTKLRGYINHHITNEFVQDMTAIMHGCTKNVLSDHVYSSLLVRNFVNVDPFKEDSKLMVFVNVSIRNNVNTQQLNMNMKQVMVREDKGSVDDDSKRSKLEVDSLVSHHTGDTRTIVSAGLNAVIRRLLIEHDIDDDLYNRVLAFNLAHAASITPINKIVLFSFLGPRIGGARSISTMSATDMAKAISIVQILSIASGYRELGHALTAKMGATMRSKLSLEDSHLRVNARNSVEFRNVKGRLESSQIIPRQASKMFANSIQEIVDSATSHVYLYNTAPVLWEVTQTECLNSQQMQFTDSLVRSICGTILTTME